MKKTLFYRWYDGRLFLLKNISSYITQSIHYSEWNLEEINSIPT